MFLSAPVKAAEQCSYGFVGSPDFDLSNPNPIQVKIRNASPSETYRVQVIDSEKRVVFQTTASLGPVPSLEDLIVSIPKANLTVGSYEVMAANTKTGEVCANWPQKIEITDTGGGSLPTSPVKCANEKVPFCLSTQPCTDSGCQVFNCKEKEGIYGCIPPLNRCGEDGSSLTDDDRCLYSQLCDQANFDCRVYSCGLVANLNDEAEKALQGSFFFGDNLQKYGMICSSQEPKKEKPDPSPPPPPCSKGFDKDGNLTSDEKQITICTSVTTALGEIDTSTAGLVKSIFSLVLGISGGIALLLIIYSGYQLMASQGNPEKLQAARDQLIAAIIGLVFIIFSLVILQVIGVDILKIPGFSE